MSENVTPTAPTAPKKPVASMRNIVYWLLPLTTIVGAVGGYFYWKYDAERRAAIQVPFGSLYKQTLDSPANLDPAFADADSNLVADAPKESDRQLDPPTL